MAQTTRVQKYQKLREEIAHLEDGGIAAKGKSADAPTAHKAQADTAVEDSHLKTDPITRGTVNIPYDELMKTHTKITRDTEAFKTEDQMALEDQKSKRWSIIGTVVTVILIVSLVIVIALILGRVIA